MADKITVELGAAADPKLILAIRTIGTGLTQLADALEAIGSDAADAPPRSARSSSGKEKSKPEEAAPPAEEETSADDQKPIELADLQKMGKDAIAAGKRDGLKKVLKDHDLANVSSAKPEQFESLHKALFAL